MFFEPTGVEIVSEEDKKKILNKKSPRLRDRLISRFKKMHRNYPSTSFFSFMSKKNVDFEYPVNVDLSREIIQEVNSYMKSEISELLPDDETVEAIKKELVSKKQIEEEDLNRETFLKIK